MIKRPKTKWQFKSEWTLHTWELWSEIDTEKLEDQNKRSLNA